MDITWLDAATALCEVALGSLLACFVCTAIGLAFAVSLFVALGTRRVFFWLLGYSVKTIRRQFVESRV